MPKENYLSDWAVQADQVGAIKAGLKGASWKQGSTHVETDLVGFVRLARDNDVSFVKYIKNGHPDDDYLLMTTKGTNCYLIHSMID